MKWSEVNEKSSLVVRPCDAAVCTGEYREDTVAVHRSLLVSLSALQTQHELYIGHNQLEDRIYEVLLKQASNVIDKGVIWKLFFCCNTISTFGTIKSAMLLTILTFVWSAMYMI